MSAELPKMLLGGKFELLERVGAGGSGEVYRALQQPLERVVALKLLRPSLGRDSSVRRRFAREARAVATLNHPNITTIYDFGLAENDLLYLAMEFIDGQSLRHHISDGLPTIPSLLIVDQILAGLAHAHARGLVHRDLKPANVLVSTVDKRLWAKIVDFGIASVAGGDRDDRVVKVVGTPRYMSPEQAQGGRGLGPATDIYNVGLILYELAAGRHPFTATTPQAMMLQHCTATVPRPLPRPGFLLPDSLEGIILRCLNKDPGGRFGSAAELRNELAEQRRALEDSGHAIYMPVAPVGRGEAEGRITLVEGTPHVVSAQPSRMAHALDVPLVGREESRSLLRGLAERACTTGRGAIVLLEGETGIGKTRLATWLKQQVVEEGSMRALAGRFLREGERGLRGVREALEQLFSTRSLPTAELSAKVVSQLVSWSLTSAPNAGFLIELLRPPEESRAPDGDRDEARSERLLSTICGVLEAGARQQPLMVLLDDLQWAGSQTADLISYLAGELQIRDIPLLVVATLRTEELAANPPIAACVAGLGVHGQDVVVRHRLPRLSDDEVAHLVQHVLPAHESLEQALLRRSEGNPLYTLHILRYLVDEELLERTETGRFIASGVDVAATVPPNLADLLLLRLTQLKRLTPERPLIEVLERAAVLGTRFPYETLAHMVSVDGLVGEAELDGVIDTLIDEGLLSQSPDSRDDLIDFEHSLVRDVLLKRLAPRRGTRRLHRLAAEAKRTFYVGRLDEVSAELSAHYEAGRELGEALRFAHLAGVTGERMHLLAGAATAWRRFLRLYDRVPSAERVAQDLPAKGDVQARLGELEDALGRYDEAEEAFRKLVPSDDTPPHTPAEVRAANGLATIALRRGRALAAERLFEMALTAAEECRESALAARAKLGLARVAWHHGRTKEALEAGRTALDWARDAGDDVGQAKAMWFLADVDRLTGDLDSSATRFEAALALFEAHREQSGRARCLYGLALIARSRGDLDRAEQLYQEAHETLRRLGARRGLAHCLNGLGEVMRFRNRLAEAGDFYRRAVDLYQAAGLETDAAVSLTNLGLVARDSGDLQGARDAMERALRVGEAAEYQYLTLGIAFNLAWVYALLGERRLCSQMLDDHLDKALKHGLVDPDFARPLEGIAELLDAAGETREARRLYERAREMWEELRRDRDASRVAALLR